MLVPALVFVACFVIGAMAATRWLPELAPGPAGGMAFFAVDGLLAGVLALAGLHVYLAIRTTELRGLGATKAYTVASELKNFLFEGGTLFGLAMVVYFLAPEPDEMEAE
jgi:hypothetical protein